MASGSSIISPDTIMQGAQRAWGAGWQMRLRREGIPVASSFTGQNNNPKTTYALGATSLFSDQPPIGRSWLMQTASGGGDAGGIGLAAQYWNENGNAPNWGVAGFAGTLATQQAGFIPAGGGSVKIPLPEGGVLLMENEQMAIIAINPVANGGGIQACLNAGFASIELTNDHDYDADYTMAFIGDSITRWTIAGTNGTAGALGKDGFPWQITTALRNRGKRVRHINYGYSGFTSAQALDWMYGGHYDVPTHLTGIFLGTNDAASNAVAPTPFQASLTAQIQRRWQLNPTGSVVVWGAPNTDDTTRTPYLPALRIAANAAVQAAGNTGGFSGSALVNPYGGYDNGLGGDVVYVDASLAFTASGSDLSNYFAETSTPHIHPNVAGHGKLAASIGAAIAMTRFWNVLLGLNGKSWS